MHDTTPITIRKHYIGLVLISLAGLSVLAVLLWILASLAAQHQLTQQTYALIATAFVATSIVTLVALYVYNLSTIYLTILSLNFSNWTSLFQDNASVTEWRHIQDVTVKKTDVLAMLFDYGTLLVQTAGTEDNLVLPMVPNVEHWRNVIEQRADAAKTNVVQS